MRFCVALGCGGQYNAAELNLPGWGGGGELEPGLVLELFKTEVTAKAPAGVWEVSLQVGGVQCEPP